MDASIFSDHEKRYPYFHNFYYCYVKLFSNHCESLFFKIFETTEGYILCRSQFLNNISFFLYKTLLTWFSNKETMSIKYQCLITIWIC